MRAAIVGAGVSGIGMAVALRQAGYEDVTIFERSDDLGGVWHDNTYPGAACDVPSYLYSYSYAQRRDWTRPCSPQQEIHDYLRDVARDHGVLDWLRVRTEITEAAWDGARARWRLTTATGAEHEADALILACGQLSRPSWPSIEGIDTFAGRSFHSARWDHGHDLHGRRVAVIGTGASAVQFVPPVARRAAHTDVYQRSAPYLLPRRNPEYPGWARGLIARVPGLQRLRRLGMVAFMESLVLGVIKVPALGAPTRSLCAAFMRHQVRDPALRRRIWPDYPFGCKRILFSSNYLPALQRPDVELVTDRIARITPTGVVTEDGTERPVDTIIYGTGFRAQELVAPLRVVGRGGLELADAWRDGAEAHLGIAVAGFPNLFLLYGPNTNLGIGSIIVMVEAQVRYVIGALALLRRAGARALVVRPEVQAASTAGVQRRLDGSVWTRCQSWYRVGGDGRIIGNWPGFMGEYVRATRRVDPADYELLGAE